MTQDAKKPKSKEPPESERDRFGRFAKKLVSVPKKEIDEKAKEASAVKKGRKRG